jgi:hypothetical protein
MQQLHFRPGITLWASSFSLTGSLSSRIARRATTAASQRSKSANAVLNNRFIIKSLALSNSHLSYKRAFATAFDMTDERSHGGADDAPFLVQFFDPSIAAKDFRGRTLKDILAYDDDALESGHD